MVVRWYNVVATCLICTSACSLESDEFGHLRRAAITSPSRALTSSLIGVDPLAPAGGWAVIAVRIPAPSSARPKGSEFAALIWAPYDKHTILQRGVLDGKGRFTETGMFTVDNRVASEWHASAERLPSCSPDRKCRLAADQDWYVVYFQREVNGSILEKTHLSSGATVTSDINDDRVRALARHLLFERAGISRAFFYE